MSASCSGLCGLFTTKTPFSCNFVVGCKRCMSLFADESHIYHGLSAEDIQASVTSLVSSAGQTRTKNISWLKAEATKTASHLLALHALINDAAPINRLHDDVLRLVFSICAKHDHQNGSLSISHVCRSWRRIALDYRGLWSRITTFHPQLVSASIERSGTMPLSIEWVRQRLLAAYDAKPTIDPILSIGDRIHSFRIVAGHGSVIPAFMTWLNCPLDRLQDLRLEWLAGSKPDNFVRCRTPTLHGTSGFWALRKLHLNGVGMLDWDWAAGVLNNLQSLHLKYAGLSYAIFARLLQSSAGTLEYVHLEDAFSRRRAFDEEDEEEPAPWEPLQAPEIRLARLRELCMRGDVYTPNDGPSMNILVPLSYLSIPETTQLLLTCRIITSEELLQSAGILPPSLFRSGPLLKITELMVVLHGYGGFTFKGTVDPDLNYYTIEVGLHHSTSYPDLSSYPDLLSHPNAFADMFGQSPIHTLTVLYNPVTFALEMGHWIELCGLEGLRCLRIAPLYQQPNFQDLEGMSHIFRVLAQGVGPKQDQRRVPRLQRVDLIYFDTGPQFLAFARACLKKRMEGRDCDPLSVWSDGIPVLGPDSESTPGDDDGDIYDTKPGPE